MKGLFLLALIPVTLIVNAPRSTPPDASLFVTGNDPALGNWQPSAVKMENIGTNVFRATFQTSDPDNLEFKITRGSWDNEAADGNAQALSNFQLAQGSTTGSILINLVDWKDQPPLGVTGRVDHIPQFFSPQLNNFRGVHVWLPPGYESSAPLAFPVIYMHDGQNVFDPATSFAGIDWGVDETMTDLIARNQVQPAIVVAVENTADRNSEYDDSIRGQLYGDFLVSTLKPFIDSHYRTKADRDSTFTMGSSMGALISLSIVWRHPETFSKAAGLSLPAFANNNMIQSMVQNNPAPSQPIYIYYDHGDQGQDAEYDPSAQALLSELRQAGVPDDHIHFQFFPYANHSELDWSRRVLVPLEFMLKK